MLLVQRFPILKIILFDVEDRNKVLSSVFFLFSVKITPTSLSRNLVLLLSPYSKHSLKDLCVIISALAIFGLFLVLPFLMFHTGIAIFSNVIWVIQLIFLCPLIILG